MATNGSTKPPRDLSNQKLPTARNRNPSNNRHLMDGCDRKESSSKTSLRCRAELPYNGAVSSHHREGSYENLATCRCPDFRLHTLCRQTQRRRRSRRELQPVPFLRHPPARC